MRIAEGAQPKLGRQLAGSCLKRPGVIMNQVINFRVHNLRLCGSSPCSLPGAGLDAAGRTHGFPTFLH
jgi:hypothetical protein